MRKVLALALAAMMLLALAACSNAGAEVKKPDENGGEGMAGMANPWSEADSAEAAAEGAGVGYFELPENNTNTSGGPVSFTSFHYMKGLAHADGFIGTAELVARTGLKQDGEDVSGDYTTYKFDWTEELDGIQVKCFGQEKGKTMKAVWVTDNFSYCILVRGQGDIQDVYGIDADAVIALVSAIQ